MDTKKWLNDLGIARAGQQVPGLLVPQLRGDGSTWGYQYRPDRPRLRGEKPVKYETPVGQGNGLDVPPGVGAALGDPATTLWITEGVKKADSAADAGLCCVALPGVWSWRGTNKHGGKTAIPDWQDVALNGRRVVLAFDSDVTVKPAVRQALTALASYLRSKGASVEYAHLPNEGDGKTGLDDYLADHSVEDLRKLVRPDAPALVKSETQPGNPLGPGVASANRKVRNVGIGEVHEVFRTWLGEEYDLDALDIVLAVAAGQQLRGDPAWLLVVSGSGAAKTETVSPLAGAGGIVTSTITSEGALLSATSTHERTHDATGGLLRKLGDDGLLVIKDVTSILSMGSEARGSVLAALREVYDGKWERNVGTDGGKSLDWTGRIVVIGAVTTAWDAAHGVIAAMGDRFLLVRIDSSSGRKQAARQAISNSGNETTMRAELGAAEAGVLAHADTSAGQAELAEDEVEVVLNLADVISLTRTAVVTDYRGDVMFAHAPEMPTRLAKQLTIVLRGALALGIERDRALDLVVRTGRDTMPPSRLAVMLDLAANPGGTTHGIAKRIGMPKTTVGQTMQALIALGLVTSEEIEEPYGASTRPVVRYELSNPAIMAALDLMCAYELKAHHDAILTQSGTGNLTTHLEKSRTHSEATSVGSSIDTPRSSPDISRTTLDLDDAAASQDECPLCGERTTPSSTGHASLCRRCTVAELEGTRPATLHVA